MNKLTVVSLALLVTSVSGIVYYIKAKQQIMQINSIHNITPQFALLNMQGKDFTTKNGKGSSGVLDVNKQGDALAIIEKQIIGTENPNGGGDIFYSGVVFGLTENPGKNSFNGVEKIGSYDAIVNQKTGHYIATFNQIKPLKNGNATFWYLTDGNGNLLDKLQFNKKLPGQMILQEVNGVSVTKKLGQLVYSCEDAKKLGLEK